MKKTAIILAGLILLASASAWALPTPLTLTMQYGSSLVTVVDGSDADGIPNVVTYIGSVGGGWGLNITAGLIGAALGSGVPQMQLMSSDTYFPTGGSLGDLIITLSGTTGPWTGAGAVAEVDGNTNVSSFSTFTTKVNGNTVSFVTGAEIGPPDPFAFSSQAENFIQMIATVGHDGYGNSSFTYRLTPVPEASTVMLLGLGLVGLAVYSKRRNSA